MASGMSKIYFCWPDSDVTGKLQQV